MVPTLVDLTSPEAAALDTLVVPLGSTEQHGPHLPLDVDVVIATEVARRLAAIVPGAVLAPAVAIGASGEHHGSPGTLSVGLEVLQAMLVELVRSAGHFRRVLFVDAHGGNRVATTAAVEQLVAEGHDVLAVRCAVPGGDAHAGHTETSMMLAIDPDRVRMALAAPGVTRPWAEIGGDVRARGVPGVSPNGVLGDPTTADAAHGRAVLDDLVGRLAGIVEHWVDDPGN